MLRLSDILHADVICKSDSSLTGKVEDVYFDEFCGKIVYFDISRADGRMLLPFSAAASVADAVVTEDSLALTSPGDADLTVLRSALIGRKISHEQWQENKATRHGDNGPDVVPDNVGTGS